MSFLKFRIFNWIFLFALGQMLIALSAQAQLTKSIRMVGEVANRALKSPAVFRPNQDCGGFQNVASYGIKYPGDPGCHEFIKPNQLNKHSMVVRISGTSTTEKVMLGNGDSIDRVYRSVGTLVGPSCRVIVMARHGVVKKFTNEFVAPNFQISYQGDRNKTYTLRTAKIVYVPNDFSIRGDWAIGILDEPIPECEKNKTYADIEATTDKQLADRYDELTWVSYVMNRDTRKMTLATRCGGELFDKTGISSFDAQDEHVILHSGPVLHGESGRPFFDSSSGRLKMLGWAKGGSREEEYVEAEASPADSNIDTLVSPELVKKVEEVYKSLNIPLREQVSSAL